MVIASFKTNKEVFKQLWGLPGNLNLDNFHNAWLNLNFSRYTFNSIIVVVISVALILIVSAPAAYALTRMRMRFANQITFFYLAGMGIPFQLLFIPLFKILKSIHLIDTLPGLIIVYVALSIPFTVFLLTGFFLTIPSELEDASQIDGCNEFQTFFKIMAPMAAPGIVTAAIFNFIGLWNEYMLALIFITTPENKTLALGLYGLQTSLQYSGDWVSVFAGAVLIIIPTTIIYVLLSEKLISGITMGAIK
ncbi:MAG: carbohydrate ABC transporter permease [Actinobacteria bacterium]|nr:carbohydrate ABC transporter permease [Actinomycetota bacterium]